MRLIIKIKKKRKGIKNIGKKSVKDNREKISVERKFQFCLMEKIVTGIVTSSKR